MVNRSEEVLIILPQKQLPHTATCVYELHI